MLWAEDDTGLLVVAGLPGKGKKAKPPKPDKKKKSGAMAVERPSMPGLPPPPSNVSSARDALLPARPSVPVGLPIVRAPAAGTTGAQTGIHGRHRSKHGGGHKLARAIGWLFVVAVIAAGGFAVGALTDLGTEAEAFVLGPTPPPAPTLDPRVPALQADLDKTRAELATARKAADDLRAATVDATPIVDMEGTPPDAAAEPPTKKHHHRKHKHGGKIDL